MARKIPLSKLTINAFGSLVIHDGAIHTFYGRQGAFYKVRKNGATEMTLLTASEAANLTYAL